MSNGDIAGFMNNLADDVTWTFFGSHRFAGTFKGKEELVAKLFAPLGEVLDGGIKVQIESMTAEGDRVVLEARGEAKTKSGQRYDNSYCIVVTVRNGKVAQVREYLDSELVTAVFRK
ncbi:MAG: nuclear transport factor 2 family protein [Gammaproteobacteria bacterium]|nr:nuclear transport factor 2 family protein [Gammaproteobacteria bacterium]